MAEQEKQAWFSLIVIGVTLAAYIAFIVFVRFDFTSMAVFAVSGLLGLRISKQGRGEMDERDRQIERQAMLSSLRVFFTLVILVPLAVGYGRGWDASLRLWAVVQTLWAISLGIWGIKSLIVIGLYRGGSHA